MKIILLENIKRLGHKGDTLEVAHGFATNFLLPKKLAKLLTEKNKSEIEQLERRFAKEQERLIAQAHKMAEKLKGMVLEIFAKATDEGKLYASITAEKIKKALKEQGIELKQEAIQLKEHIKATGEYTVDFILENGISAQLKVKIKDTDEKSGK